MADINIGKAPPNNAVLPFYATASVAFAVLCLLLLLNTDSLLTHYFNPHLLAIVHITALGWATMIIFGAAHQLLPVICERDLFSPPLATLSWYTLTAGSFLLVVSFWNLTTGWLMISGGLLILVSVLAYCANALLTSRICSRYSVVRLFITTSSLWLVFTVAAGVLLAINLYRPFFSINHLEALKLHAHMGLAGWFLQLVAGVSSKLVPMFLLAKSAKEKLLKYACLLQNSGLILFLADGYLSGKVEWRAMLYAALVATGVLCWLLYLYDAFRNRVRKSIDVHMKHTFVSFIFLIGAIFLIPVVFFSKGYSWTILYGTFLFMGWLSGIILGKTFKTLPFIVWNSHYKALSGKVKVPLPKQLYSEPCVTWQFRLYIAGMIVLPVGLMTVKPLVQAGLGIWFLLSVLYLYNVLKVLLHKTKTSKIEQ